MHILTQTLIRSLFPRSCLICSSDISSLEYRFHVCPHCLNKISHAGFPAPQKISPLNGFSSPFHFKPPLQDILHLFKYQGKDYLTSMLIDLWLKNWQGPNPSNFDALVPVPMPYWRELFRGYNQATLLAQELGRRWGKSVITNRLKRRFRSASQTKLGKTARMANAQKSFYVKNGAFFPKNILLIDDVFTTGATLKACACLLKNRGATYVFGAAIAREI